MKIGIDARFFGPHEKGLGRYTGELVSHLQRIDNENDYVCFFQQRDFDNYRFTNPRWSKVLADVRWYTMAEQIVMPRLMKKSGVDAMLFPHYNVPLRTHVPYIVTIHDLIIHHFPTRRATTLGPVKQAVKMIGYHVTISRAVKKAQHVITVSEFTKKDIVNTFGVSNDHVTVTYESAEKTHEQPRNDLAHYHVATPYFLYVGNAYPHKNLDTLIENFQIFRAEHNEYSLVLVGKKEYFYNRLQTEMNRRGLTDNVLFVGYVPDGDLSVLYENARGYIFPSRYEGFGLPPLEAMLHDTPVASSNASCLPEILEDAAIYFDPDNGREMVSAMAMIADDESLRERLRRAGNAQVAKYSWDRMARETKEIIQKTFAS